MSVNGLCAPIADATSLVYAGPEWVAAIPKGFSYVKCSVGGPRNADVLPSLLQQGAHSYLSAGYPMQWCLEASLAPLGCGMTNDALTLPSVYHRLKTNAWIRNWTSAAITLLQGTPASLRPTSIIIGNEQNVQGAAQTIASGYTIPYLAPGAKPDPLKPEAVSPECTFVWWYYAGMRIQDKFPDIVIYPGAMSIDAAFNTSMEVGDGWVGDFYQNGMQSLVDAGLHEPFPWHGFLANVEGVVSRKYGDYIAYWAAHIKGNWKITGPNLWTEWGVPANNLSIAAMTDTSQNLDRGCASKSLFQMQSKTPGSVLDYGLMDYGYANGVFVPKEPTAWVAALPTILGLNA